MADDDALPELVPFSHRLLGRQSLRTLREVSVEAEELTVALDLEGLVPRSDRAVVGYPHMKRGR